MDLAEKVHKLLVALFMAVFVLAVWGLTQRSHPGNVSLVFWTALGAVSAVGAILQTYTHIRIRRGIGTMTTQIETMSDRSEVGSVMVEDDTDLAGLAGMVNHYLTKIRGEIDEHSRRERELGVLVSAIKAEKDNTEAVIKNISDGVLVLNGFGQLMLANWFVEQLFGFDADRAKGRPVEEFISQPRICELVERARDHRDGPLRAELWLAGAAGADKCFELTVRAVCIEREDLWAIVVILHDVTRERELRELKNEFINHVTHELRTPLCSIKAYVEVLLDDELREASQRKEFHRIIHTESIRLERFIENILNFNRIESGLMPVHAAAMDLSRELCDLVRLMGVQAEEKGIAIDIEIPDDLELHADSDLLRQAVLNLLANAVKYTPEGGRITLRAGIADSDQCRIEVIDTGIGIAPQDQERIFEKFYRTRTGHEIAPGTGLGLALSKRIVEELHGGHLSVQSTANEGTTFTIMLPRVAASDRNVVHTSTLTAGSS